MSIAAIVGALKSEGKLSLKTQEEIDMARQCGVCGQPPREGEEMRPIRLGTEDVEAVKELLSEGGRKMRHEEIGLYMSCEECFTSHRKRVADRLEIELSAVTNGQLC